MTAKEWLDIMKQADDYPEGMTSNIEHYVNLMMSEKVAQLRTALLSQSVLYTDAGKNIFEREVDRIFITNNQEQ